MQEGESSVRDMRTDKVSCDDMNNKVLQKSDLCRVSK